jgi:hypothetical protein
MRSILFMSTLASGLALSAVAWADSAPPQSYQSQIEGATNHGSPIYGRYPMYEGRAAADERSYVYTPQGEFAPAGAPPVQYAPGGAGGYTTIP